jgi:hypothetical protein
MDVSLLLRLSNLIVGDFITGYIIQRVHIKKLTGLEQQI